MASQKDKKIIYRKIKDYIKVAKENGFNIWRVYLFGSYVTGRFTANSDIDIAIFLNTNAIDGFSEDAHLMKLTRRVDVRIEPHSFAKIDFDDADPFVREIVTKGKRVL